LLLVLFGALLILTPALANGRPLVFTDTRAYYVLGGQIAEQLRLVRPGQSAADLAGAAPAPGARPVAAPDLESRKHIALTVAGSRSPYYSFYLFVTQAIGGLWLTAAIQALLAAWLLYLVARVAAPGPRRPLVYLGLAAAATAAGLGLHAGFMMPDVFTGLGVLAAVVWLFYAERATRAERAMLCLLMAFAAMAHATNMLLLLAGAILGAAALALLGAGRRLVLVRAGGVALAAVAGIAGSAAYTTIGGWVAHAPLHSPPFLTARVLADGPGRAYLRDACAKDPEAYALCAFKDRRLDDADDFLWRREAGGAFASADYDTRVRLIAEQRRFVLGAVVHDPIGQIAASARNWARQAGMSGVVDDVLTDGVALAQDDRFAVYRRIIPGYAACAAAPGDCATRLPRAVLAPIQGALVVLSLIAGAFAAIVLWRRASAGWRDPAARAVVAFLAVCLLLAANAAICGALSGPAGRYQTRLGWIAPAAALMAVAAALTRRRPADD
jgi:hypothetical protein